MEEIKYNHQEKIYPVIIIGAGAAGIAAGRTLQKQGIEYLILEGRDRVGGRVYSDQINNY